MALKIYKKGAYVVINNSGKLTELNSAEVSITKDTEAIDIYEVKHNGVPVLKAQLTDILDENGVAYVEAAWDIFRYEQTGSVNSSEVANPYPAPTTTVVNISSAQILAMGTTPITLLPAPGVGMYYDINWDNTYLEFSKGATPYNIGTIESVKFDFSDGYSSNFITSDFLTETNNISIPLRPSLIYNITGGKLIQGYVNLNTSLILASYNSSNNPEDPTLGNGTLRAIITYTTRTFGA